MIDTLKYVTLFLLVGSLFQASLAGEDSQIVAARIESCMSCQLKRLPEVRSFIYDDVPKYVGVEWKKIHGAPPELLFLNEADEEIERHKLEKLSRAECNDLLKSKGFKIKEAKEL